MPASAVATGRSTPSCRSADMPARLLAYQQADARRAGGKPRWRPRGRGGHLATICAHPARARSATTSASYKQKHPDAPRPAGACSVVAGRLRSHDYIEYLRQDPNEVEQLFRDLLIGVTQLLPRPGGLRAPGAPRSIPSAVRGQGRATASCASGCPAAPPARRPIRIAILLREHMAGSQRRRRCRSSPPTSTTRRWSRARAGALPARRSPASLAGAAGALLRQGRQHATSVSSEIREMCVFSPHNVIARSAVLPARPGLLPQPADLPGRRPAEAGDRRSSTTRCGPGGYPVPGPLGERGGQPRPVPHARQEAPHLPARDTVARPAAVRFPLSERGAPAASARRREPPAPPAPASRRSRGPVETLCSSSYAPACVVVNARATSSTSRRAPAAISSRPRGRPTVNVVDMARKGLRLDLRTALHKAVQTSRVRSSHENVAVELDERHAAGQPDRAADAGARRRAGRCSWSSSRRSAAGGRRSRGAAVRPRPRRTMPIVPQLEAELRDDQDHLQAHARGAGDVERGAEVLERGAASMNEELQSANEELQTSKEELQSVNEELETVNAELKEGRRARPRQQRPAEPLREHPDRHRLPRPRAADQASSPRRRSEVFQPDRRRRRPADRRHRPPLPGRRPGGATSGRCCARSPPASGRSAWRRRTPGTSCASCPTGRSRTSSTASSSPSSTSPSSSGRRSSASARRHRRLVAGRRSSARPSTG